MKTDQEVIDELKLECIYSLFHCLMCGIPWAEHANSCPNHRNIRKYEYLRVRVAEIPDFKHIFESAKRNGFVEYIKPEISVINGVSATNGDIEQNEDIIP